MIEGDSGTLTNQFVQWYTQRKGSCPLTFEELYSLQAEWGSAPGNHLFRREVLREARRALAGKLERLGTDSALAQQFNELREDLALAYLSDRELAPAARADAAIDVLFAEATGFDDLRRKSTLEIAGRAFRERAIARGDLDDLIAAASYYTAGWGAAHSVRAALLARLAAELWLRSANDEEQHGRRPYDPQSSVDRRIQLIADRRRAANDLFLELIEQSEATLKSIVGHLAAPAASVASEGDSGNIDAAWERIVRVAVTMSQDPGSPGAAAELNESLLDEAWDAALGLVYGYFAVGRWEHARTWSTRTAAVVGSFILAMPHTPDPAQRFRDVLRDMLVLQSLLAQASDPPQESVAILAELLERRLRDGLQSFFVRQSERAFAEKHPDEQQSLDQEFELYMVSAERSSTFSFAEGELARLAQRIIRDQRRGRIGLALSGGGFRASFYHLGVLARLADVDLLRSVEMISGVSGGAIIGACYYLKLKQLLEERHDARLSREDYVSLVRSLCDEFLDGVQTNIRTRIFASVPGMWRLWFKPGYTRTNRVAELVESELFARVTRDQRAARSAMGDLRISPYGEEPTFRPELDNWHRAAKVPIFVINATALNTGHNWQFTSWTAGEPAFAIDPEVDATPRLRTFAYPQDTLSQGPKASLNITLASAVSASACVPGLFPPIEFTDLYLHSGEIRIKLVDGGVFDNQGTSALIDQGCDVVIVSDGSQQIEFDPTPTSFWLASLRRMNTMLMERVRQLQFHALAARRNRGNLRHLFLMHLTRGLESEAINSLGQHGIDDHISSAPWFNNNQKWVEALKRGENKIELTRYEIARNLQQLLAGVRTDLDSFHQVEAYALFCSGYRMAFIELAKVSAGLLTEQESRAPANNWRMGKIWPLLGDNSSGNAFVLRSLEFSQSRFFKAARRHTQQTAAVGGAVAVILIVVETFGRQPLYKMIVITFPVVAWGAALVVTGAGIIAVVRGLYQWKGFGPFIRIATQTFLQLVTGCVLPFALLGSRIHLAWIDSRYLKDGAFDTIDGRPGGAQVLS